MAATIIDSKIFGDMFSDAKMRQVWSDENRTEKYIDVERALSKVQGELGIIPKEAADEIV
ncbi:MAG TPA: 3-carboxy-cis,cis-muconate cycloisomerase, partial [Burkholderiales bacterium]|nr:3-carboxy-cis,cis-muconate cycloisomerase [Burkholderiales bacterium]